ncbi:hypothetical protein BDP27DRAFT_1401541 [Rhodocollybia butyracea]|uniref:Uncharacterized protein n=1 Tax=Rhodocollybia butyracea TaxID=206335 RepID=A0A9P5PY09_9AGAR|nr:hypothetical protein BDP27DRAFT_1401541 [Rhodocollybia butyracea]
MIDDACCLVLAGLAIEESTVVMPIWAEDLVESNKVFKERISDSLHDDVTPWETSHVCIGTVTLNSSHPVSNVMSTQISPRRLPPDQTPPRRDRTGCGEYRSVISAQWKGPFGGLNTNYSYELLPSAVHGMDGKFNLVAEWNKPHSGHTSEAIIEAARKAMGVDKDATLEATLQWHRFPLTWLAQEEDEKEKLALKGVENIHSSNQPAGVR